MCCSPPLLPAHSALISFFFSGVGNLARPLFAVASVARPVFLAFVGSSVSSCDSLPVGHNHVPSQCLASVRRPVRVDQSECCSVSAQRGRDVVAASLVKPAVAHAQSSQKVILNRQVVVVDLGLVGSRVTIAGRSVVGPQAPGRQPQKLPSSLHCVLRLRGGAGNVFSSSGGSVADGDDVSSAGSVVLADEAVGSGVCDDRGILDDDGEDAVSVASAGVPANEEGGIGSGSVGHVYPIFVEGYRHPRGDFAFSPFDTRPCPNGPEFRTILYDAPPLIPRDVSSASSVRSSSVVDGGQCGNRGRSATLNGGVLSAPRGNRVDAGGVKEELAVRSSVARSLAVRSSAARSSVARSSVVPSPVSRRVPVVNDLHGAPIAMRMLGRQWVTPGPISHGRSAWYTLSVRRPVVLSRSSSLEVGPPSVGNAPESVSVDGDDRLLCLGVVDLIKLQFDDVLVQSYGYPGNGGQLLPCCTPLFNKLACVVPAGGSASVASPVRLSNIRIGRPAIASRMHVWEVVRFQRRTFIHNLGGRKTNTWCSTMSVRNGHHEGRTYFAPGCTSNPPLPKYCRIVYIDT